MEIQWFHNCKQKCCRPVFFTFTATSTSSGPRHKRRPGLTVQKTSVSIENKTIPSWRRGCLESMVFYYKRSKSEAEVWLSIIDVFLWKHHNSGVKGRLQCKYNYNTQCNADCYAISWQHTIQRRLQYNIITTHNTMQIAMQYHYNTQ